MSLHSFRDQEICMEEKLEKERVILWSPKERKKRVKDHPNYRIFLHIWGEESMDISQIEYYLMDVDDIEKYGYVIPEWDVIKVKNLDLKDKKEGIWNEFRKRL